MNVPRVTMGYPPLKFNNSMLIPAKGDPKSTNKTRARVNPLHDPHCGAERDFSLSRERASDL